MTFQLITNLDNGAGLQHDYELLRNILEGAGHQVNPVHIHRPQTTVKKVDVNIFLEVVLPSVIRYADKNWIIPNSEWWGSRWDAWLPSIDRVLCKTLDCYRIWRNRVPADKCVYIGWMSQDLWDPSIPREPAFLHTAGKSLTKNTAAVIEAWKRYALPHQLIVSAFKPEIAALCKGVSNVTLVNRFSADELKRTVNRCQFFLMPSKYEGYGHAIHEALGCQAAVLTTDAAPMSSFSGICSDLLIPVERSECMSLARVHYASPQGIAERVRYAASLPSETVSRIGCEARTGFMRDNSDFIFAVQKEIREC